MSASSLRPRFCQPPSRPDEHVSRETQVDAEVPDPLCCFGVICDPLSTGQGFIVHV
jgi:hypothetical protein